MAFTLPKLPYEFNALEPHIDARTMEIHHELDNKSVEDLLKDLNAVPEDIRTAVRNNGGGHWNHSMFWEIMSPKGGGQRGGALADAIKKAFGDFASLQEKLAAAAVGQFGSGWGWLVKDSSGALSVVATPNQDNPMSSGMTPILGVDVWEHAYYLNYQNRRPDYVAAWWNVVHWPEGQARFDQAKG